MSKPLSDTHPTLWKRVEFKTWGLSDVQECTVDIAEHEKLVKLYGESERGRGALLAEVVRLKKEVDAERILRYELWEQHKKEGEEEALRRVREVMEKHLLVHFEGGLKRGEPDQPTPACDNGKHSPRVCGTCQELFCEDCGWSDQCDCDDRDGFDND